MADIASGIAAMSRASDNAVIVLNFMIGICLLVENPGSDDPLDQVELTP